MIGPPFAPTVIDKIIFVSGETVAAAAEIINVLQCTSAALQVRATSR
jgi:hypothetical protein